jgi:hypothetical protein
MGMAELAGAVSNTGCMRFSVFYCRRMPADTVPP